MGDAMDGAKTGKFGHYVDVMKSLVQASHVPVHPLSGELQPGPVQLERQEMGWINAVARIPTTLRGHAGAPMVGGPTILMQQTPFGRTSPINPTFLGLGLAIS
jgi:hypothetical protein